MSYQDALYKNRPVKGGRECDERWELIAPYVPNAGMMLDVGSDLGFFSVKAALDHPKLAVVSLEAQEESARLQAKVLSSSALTRVCLIQGMLNSAAVEAWSQRSDWFDLTLLLSVVHWFDDPAAVVRRLSQMSGSIIAEMVDPQDAGACGQERIARISDPLKWLKHVTHRNCTEIGRCKRHTSSEASHLILINGPTDLNFRATFWDDRISNGEGDASIVHFDGDALCSKKNGTKFDYRPGTNVANLMKLGRIIHPKPEYWTYGLRSVLKNSKDSPDLLTHNIVWSANGVEVIGGRVESEAKRCRLVWQVGGTVENSKKAAQVLQAQHKMAAKNFRYLVRAWSRNETAAAICSSYEPSWVIRSWKNLKRLIRQWLPNGWVVAIRRILRS